MPKILILLQHNDSTIKSTGANILSELSEQCELLWDVCNLLARPCWSIWSWVSGTNWGGNATDCCPPAAQWWEHPMCWCKCIVKTVWTLWDLSNLPERPCWYQFEAVFWAPIGEAMPQIVALLQDKNEYIQGIGAGALSKLSEQCEISAIFLKGHANTNLKLSFGQQLRRQCHRL